MHFKEEMAYYFSKWMHSKVNVLISYEYYTKIIQENLSVRKELDSIGIESYKNYCNLVSGIREKSKKCNMKFC